MAGRKTGFFLTLFLYAGATNLNAQDSLFKEPFSVASDYACFREGPACRLEIYYSLSSTDLEFTPADSFLGGQGKSYAVVLANLDLFTVDGKPVDSLSKTTAFRVTKADTTNQLSDFLSLTVLPGNYQARLEVADLKSGRVGYDTLHLTVEDLLAPGLKLSSIQLARFIREEKRSETSSHYRKAGRQIVPNPGGGYTLDDPRLYYYVEIYNLVSAAENLKNFELEYAILGNQNETLKISGFYKYPKEETPVAAGSVDLSALAPGKYTLSVSVREPATDQTATQSKAFWLYPPSRRPPIAEEELDLFPKVTYYLLSKEEKLVFESSNRTGRLNFINDYWKKHDSAPDTPDDEFKRQAYGRYYFSIDRFSTTPTAKDGWKTDRGRVHMLYGEPSNIERSPASPSNLPWEKWDYYRIAGGRQAYFIFADLRGLRNYQLVHSTAPGEKQNPDWENLVNQNLLRH